MFTAWKWSDSQAPVKLVNRIPEYPVSSKLREEYQSQLQTWIDSSWLLPYSNEELGLPKELILLMAELQTNKQSASCDGVGIILL